MKNLQNIQEFYLWNVNREDRLEIEKKLSKYTQEPLGEILKLMNDTAEQWYQNGKRPETVKAEDNISLINHVLAQFNRKSKSTGNHVINQFETKIKEGINIMPPKNQYTHMDAKEQQPKRNSQLPEKEHQDIATALKDKLCFPTDTQTFADFRTKSSVYVDKSLLIKEVLESGDHLLLTCPRRWGKSLNLSMLKAFFQPDGHDPIRYTRGTIASGQYDFDGNSAGRITDPKINQKFRDKYKGANKNLIYFIKLNIDGQKTVIPEMNDDGRQKPKMVDVIEHYQGKLPVIYMDLKGLKTDNIDNARMALRSAIASAYQEHSYLYFFKLFRDYQLHKNTKKPDLKRLNDALNQANNLGEKITILESYMTPEKRSEPLKKLHAYYHGKAVVEAPIQNSLSFLSELLYEYFGQQVIMLIDEYDAAVNKILE